MDMSVGTAEFVNGWSNWILVGALIVGVVATYGIVISSNVKEAALKLELGKAAAAAADANERAAELAKQTEALHNENLKLRASIAPRALTKEQFEAIQTLRGKIGAVNIAYDTDSETVTFALQIAVALQKAGITTNLFQRDASVHSSGTFLYDHHAFANPAGRPTGGEPIEAVLKDIGLGGTIIAIMPNDLIRAGAPLDVPMIVVGGKLPLPHEAPYLGKSHSSDAPPK